MKSLTMEEAKKLELPKEVWLEEMGGFDRTHYRAEKVTASWSDDEMMSFGGSGRAWRAWGSYNCPYCGWRIWLKNPTDHERLDAEWDGT